VAKIRWGIQVLLSVPLSGGEATGMNNYQSHVPLFFKKTPPKNVQVMDKIGA